MLLVPAVIISGDSIFYFLLTSSTHGIHDDNGLIGDQAVGQPHHEQRLEESYDQEKVVTKFAGSLCDVRLNRQT